MGIELEVIDKWYLFRDKTFILYGASSNGRKAYGLLKNFNINIEFFCDGDNKKWGKSICELPIITLEQLKILMKNSNYMIIISSVKNIEIKDQLKDIGIDENRITTALSVSLGIFYYYNEQESNTNDNIYFKNLYINWKKRMRLSIETEVDYITAKAWEILCMHNSITIFQNTKVGSTSIVEGLINAGIVAQHPHTLRYIPWLMDKRKKEIYDYMINYCKYNKKTKIITLVREPISRDLSLLFQSIKYLYCMDNNFTQKSNDCFLDRIRKNMEYYINFKESDWSRYDRIDTTFISYQASTHYGCQFDWYDRELKEIFEIDIFKYPFDKDKGYTIIKKENIEVLVMKFEKLKELEHIIADFTDALNFRLPQANNGKLKSYALLYEEVKNNLIIPKSVINLYYENNPRMDHFYTEQEKQKFLKKWTNNHFT